MMQVISIHAHRRRRGGRQLVDLVNNALLDKVDAENVGQLGHERLRQLQRGGDDRRVAAGQQPRHEAGRLQVLQQRPGVYNLQVQQARNVAALGALTT